MQGLHQAIQSFIEAIFGFLTRLFEMLAGVFAGIDPEDEGEA